MNMCLYMAVCDQVLFMDADMIAYEGLTSQVVNMTVAGKLAFAPIVWSTDWHPQDWYLGSWRNHGTGMIAFYMSDFLRSGLGIPLANRTSYGGEDHIFMMQLDRKSGIRYVDPFPHCTSLDPRYP